MSHSLGFAPTFEEAIAHTKDLFTQFTQNNLTNQELQQAIAHLITTDNGARGFFVFYLTNEIVDRPTESVIQALQNTSSPLIAELLVKNLVMSTAMVITHNRNHNLTMAQSSQKVSDRTATLIKLVNLPQVKEIAQQMQRSAQLGTGEYADFLNKWGYDQEQKSAIASMISPTFL
jgi:hypothetical protein